MGEPRFQRTVENFRCLHCGFFVEGSGYTNHCPKCLWSKHVDVNPGDRESRCGGPMEPWKLEGSSPTYDIIHRCTLCGIVRKNKVDAADDIDAILAIAKNE